LHHDVRSSPPYVHLITAFHFVILFIKLISKLLPEARNLDFTGHPEQSRQLFNTWVEEKTKHRIRDLLPGMPLSSSLANTHARRFKASNTHDRDFHPMGDGGAKKVKMMEQNKLKTRHAAFDDHAMQLPYKGHQVVMLVMLPHENSPAALEAVRVTSFCACS
jgi:serpin B